LPVFVSVNVCCVDAVFTGWFPKAKLPGVRLAPAWVPVPESDTCWPPAVSVPETAPGAFGVKVTLTVHELRRADRDRAERDTRRRDGELGRHPGPLQGEALRRVGGVVVGDVEMRALLGCRAGLERDVQAAGVADDERRQRDAAIVALAEVTRVRPVDRVAHERQWGRAVVRECDRERLAVTLQDLPERHRVGTRAQRARVDPRRRRRGRTDDREREERGEEESGSAHGHRFSRR
jgi:hypothetical protein